MGRWDRDRLFVARGGFAHDFRRARRGLVLAGSARTCFRRGGGRLPGGDRFWGAVRLRGDGLGGGVRPGLVLFGLYGQIDVYIHYRAPVLTGRKIVDFNS